MHEASQPACHHRPRPQPRSWPTSLPHTTTPPDQYRLAPPGRTQGRWACDDKEQQAETWYNLTATEIAVIHHPDNAKALPYALTTARLCNHALAWEHRTRHPLPIHAAIQMDKNHPEYRRTIDWEADDATG
ncbi:RNaseH domain-containing protein [Streptomyces sp. SID685]|uniref:RNaseH domain-containing protein n=1 Tax=Streptomyces sp. SID685 TaxID=2690322 RepID=UPI001F1B850C|nr:RNaseH domain-containing protein [Streptomyces sp. SID685]